MRGRGMSGGGVELPAELQYTGVPRLFGCSIPAVRFCSHNKGHVRYSAIIRPTDSPGQQDEGPPFTRIGLSLLCATL